MKNHSVKLAIRNLLKQKSFSLISLAGLATALAASIVVLTYFFHEISFDKHIPESERTYRIISRYGEGNFWARTFACYGDALENRPQVEAYTSFIYINNGLVNIGEADYTVSESVVADTGFIDFFGLRLISGRKEDLGLPNHLFLTPELAETFFPGENPVGREILLRNFEGNSVDSLGHYLIAGLIEPLPDNTHFGYKMIVSQTGHYSERLKHLKDHKLSGANVYVRLFQNVPSTELEAELIDLVVPYLEGKPGPPMEAFNASLQPVRDIHFTTDIHREPRPVTRKSMIYILLSVGLLILTLMTLNFVSMVTVQSHEQGKASRIMRIMGADKTDLFKLSLFKIAVLVGLSLVLTWIIIALSESFLQTLFGSSWTFRSLSRQIFLVGLGAGFLVILFTALGTHLSVPGKGSFKLFGWLTVVQFAIVIILVGFSMMIERQIRFLDRKDLGYTDENILITRIPGRNPRGSLLVEEIEKQAGVISASTAQYHPGDIFQSMEFTAGGQTYPFGFRIVDAGVLETLEIDLVHRFGSQTGKLRGWVINESFYKELLLNFSPEMVATSDFSLGSEEQEDARAQFEIAAVMKDFHFSSLHNTIGNFAFVIRDPATFYNRWLMVRFSEGQSENVLKSTNQMMDTFFPGKANDQFMLEDNLTEQYKGSFNLSRLIRLFSLLSVLIAISGLYGLSLYMTRKRTREIGIRKIHGASTSQIIEMLNLGFLKWVGMAFIIAFPVTLWALRKWLMNFAYQSTMPWWIFALSGISIAFIAMIAVTWQTRSAARLDPVETFRFE